MRRPIARSCPAEKFDLACSCTFLWRPLCHQGFALPPVSRLCVRSVGRSVCRLYVSVSPLCACSYPNPRPYSQSHLRSLWCKRKSGGKSRPFAAYKRPDTACYIALQFDTRRLALALARAVGVQVCRDPLVNRYSSFIAVSLSSSQSPPPPPRDKTTRTSLRIISRRLANTRTRPADHPDPLLRSSALHHACHSTSVCPRSDVIRAQNNDCTRCHLVLNCTRKRTHPHVRYGERPRR